VGRSRLAIVIPAYSEATSIEGVARAAASFGTVLVVDDCSPDETASRAERAGATVVRNSRNLGYDKALSRGFEEAAQRGFTHVVTIDADGEHDPGILSAFCELLLAQGIPLVIGVRRRRQRVAEVAMCWYVRLSFGPRDILCGMKGYDLALWRENGGFDHTQSIGTELAINAIRRGAPFREVNVDGQKRMDAPRFDSRLRANLRILISLMGLIRRDLSGRRWAVQ
jgi:glycosyltransferase involved in cell wall biosynthesis